MKARRIRFLVIFSYVFLFSIGGYSQDRASIEGSVTDASNSEVLIGANVYLKGTSIGSITDASGRYTIKNIPVGKYTLIASYLGYETHKEEIVLSAAEKVEKNIQLKYSGAIKLSGVVVTTQAKGQFKAINQQLSSEDIKNVVSSDRIRELPDANAAESLSRLPGISLKRSGGEGDKVVVRGLSPKYTKVMVDGVEIASTSSYDRSVSLSGISAYSLEGIEVIKSPTADMEANFIGGAVNFKLRSAPKGFRVEAMAQGTYNHLKNTYNDYNFMLNISNRFFHDRFGIFIMGQIENRNRSAFARDVHIYPYNSGVDTSDVTLSSEKFSDELRNIKRNNATAVFDYKLNNGIISFKNFYSQRNNSTVIYNQTFPAKQRVITLGTTNNDSDQKILNNTLRYEQTFGAFKIEAQVAHAYSGSNSPKNLYVVFSQDDAMDQVPDNIDPDSIMNYSNFNIERTRIKRFYHTPGTMNNNQTQANLDLTWSFVLSSSWSGKLKAGGKYKYQSRNYDYDYWITDLITAGQAMGRTYIADNKELFTENDIEDEAYIKYSYFIDPSYDVSRFFNGQFKDWAPGTDIPKLEHVQNYFMHDYFAMRDTIPYNLPYLRHDMYKSLTYDYNGNENYFGTYIMGSFEYKKLITFIPGVRYEKNNTEYSAHQGNSLRSGPIYYRYMEDTILTTHRSNYYFLPMIHLKIKPLDWLQFHLAYTHTLTRPNYKWIIPRQDYGNQDSKNPQLIINNTQLKPEMSRNFDFVVSFHNNYLGMLNINLFTKNIVNKIFRDYTKKVMNRYDEFNIPKIYSGYNYNWYYNDTFGVSLKGLELEWQTSFWYLPGALKGLVLNINYTFIKSKATYPAGHSESFDHDNNPFTPDTTVFYNHPYESRLIDQPSHIINVSLGYDYKGFSIRASMRYQDDIFRSTAFVKNMRTKTGHYLRFDVSTTQKLPYGIKLFANLNNLNNAEDLVYAFGTDYPIHTEQYGMTIDFGLRWNFKFSK